MIPSQIFQKVWVEKLILHSFWKIPLFPVAFSWIIWKQKRIFHIFMYLEFLYLSLWQTRMWKKNIFFWWHQLIVRRLYFPTNSAHGVAFSKDRIFGQWCTISIWTFHEAFFPLHSLLVFSSLFKTAFFGGGGYIFFGRLKSNIYIFLVFRIIICNIFLFLYGKFLKCCSHTYL